MKDFKPVYEINTLTAYASLSRMWMKRVLEPSYFMRFIPEDYVAPPRKPVYEDPKLDAIDWAWGMSTYSYGDELDPEEFEAELKRRGFLIVPDANFDPTRE